MAVGEDAGNVTQGVSAVAVGSQAGYNNQGAWAIAIGLRAGQDNQGEHSICIGDFTGDFGTSEDAVNIGSGAGGSGSGVRSINFGEIAGFSSGAFDDAICIGSASNVTAGNQLQLGNSNIDTFAYGAVQDRSDRRDKADINDTPLGLNFIMAVRPVEYRWDYREDYIAITKDEHGKKVVTPIAKDGSKKRTRFHQGVIADEVKTVMDDLGIDFGGYQDHSINGGSDVKSIGYAEFIGPLIKSVQELNGMILERDDVIAGLISRIEALENA